MYNPRLGQTGQRFMQAVDHHVGPQIDRAVRKTVAKAEVCPVGLVHDQRFSMSVNDPGDGRNVADNALISGAGNHDCLDFGLSFQCPGNVFRRNSAWDPCH